MTFIVKSGSSYQLLDPHGETLHDRKVSEAADTTVGGEPISILASEFRAYAGNTFHLERRSNLNPRESLRNDRTAWH